MDQSLNIFGIVVILFFAIFVIVGIARSIVIVNQPQAYIGAGLHFLMPFFDKIRAKVDLRELVYSFPPQSVITSDNLVVDIDSVIYFQVTDPKAAVYEIANYITGVEQLTVTTLRNIVGTMD